VEYRDAVEICDSSRTCIEHVPFFINRSDGGLTTGPMGAPPRRVAQPWWHGGAGGVRAGETIPGAATTEKSSRPADRTPLEGLPSPR
jgi:hypothetical protein